MRKFRISVLLLMTAGILLLSGCDVWDMIMEDMLRDILSKLNPFSNLFTGNGSIAVPPTNEQAAGVAAITTALVTLLALSNGTFQSLIAFFGRLGQGSPSTVFPDAGPKTPEVKNAAELWETITNGGPELEKLTRSLMDRKLENLVSGSLPETCDIVGAPPTWEDINKKLNDTGNQLSGTENPDNWKSIRELLDKGTTVRSVIVGLLTMAGVSFTAATAPWVIGAGLAAGLIDKFMPDSLSILTDFFEAEKPERGVPEADGIVWTPVPPEKYPELKKEDLWKLPRDERLKMWQDSRDWIQKLGGSEPPTTTEEWETRYEMTNKLVNQYELEAKNDPNILDSNNYKKWRYQRDLLDTLRARGPRMELQ